MTTMFLVLNADANSFSLDIVNMQQSSVTALWSNISQSTKVVELRWKSDDDIDWIAGQQFLPNISQFAVKGLQSDTKYYFSLRTLDVYLNYSPDLSVSAETISAIRATNIRKSNVTSASITVTWVPASAASLAGQLISISSDGGASWGYNQASSDGPVLDRTVSAASIVALLPDSSYLVRVDSLFVGLSRSLGYKHEPHISDPRALQTPLDSYTP